MAFLDLFMSGAQKRDIGHFASIVRLAMADQFISNGEQKLLDRMSVRLNISERTKKKILRNPEKFPINPPVSFDNRIERLYNLTKMIFADSESIEKEASILVKVGVGLGFPTKDVDRITDEALKLAMNDINLNDFTVAIKKISAA